MKTIIRAVNKFKAEFPRFDEDIEHVTQILMAKFEFDGYKQDHLTTGNQVKDNKYWDVVCDSEEFDKCVDMLTGDPLGLIIWQREHSLEFRLSQFRVSQFELIEEVKPAILDDNSMQAKISNIGNVLHNLSCSADDDEQDGLGAHASFLWDLSKGYAATVVGKTENSKPIFTQNMVDTGELPSVGMEFMWSAWGDNKYQCAKMLGQNGRECWIEVGETTMIVGNLSDFKPLTPPVVLEDGKAYEFYCGDGYGQMIGYYKEDRKSFFSSRECCIKIAGLGECRNITPLTPPRTDIEIAIDLIIDKAFKEMEICFELKSNHDDSLVSDDTQIGVEFATEFIRSKLIQLLEVK